MDTYTPSTLIESDDLAYVARLAKANGWPIDELIELIRSIKATPLKTVGRGYWQLLTTPEFKEYFGENEVISLMRFVRDEVSCIGSGTTVVPKLSSKLHVPNIVLHSRQRSRKGQSRRPGIGAGCIIDAEDFESERTVFTIENQGDETYEIILVVGIKNPDGYVYGVSIRTAVESDGRPRRIDDDWHPHWHAGITVRPHETVEDIIPRGDEVPNWGESWFVMMFCRVRPSRKEDTLENALVPFLSYSLEGAV